MRQQLALVGVVLDQQRRVRLPLGLAARRRRPVGLLRQAALQQFEVLAEVAQREGGVLGAAVGQLLVQNVQAEPGHLQPAARHLAQPAQAAQLVGRRGRGVGGLPLRAALLHLGVVDGHFGRGADTKTDGAALDGHDLNGDAEGRQDDLLVKAA